MSVDARPEAGATRLRASAKSFLSIFLSTAFAFPAGIGWPTPVAGAEKGQRRAVSLHEDRKAKQDPVLKGLPITELSADEAILHVLNRLAYGPRPGDVGRGRQRGLAEWSGGAVRPHAIV